MLTTNYEKWCKTINVQSPTATGLYVTDIDGNKWQLAGCESEMILPTVSDFAAAVSNGSLNATILIGSNNTAATVDDYAITPLSGITTQVTTTFETAKYTNQPKCVKTIVITAKSAVQIGEIAYAPYVSVLDSANNQDYAQIIVDRVTFDPKISLANGSSKTIKYAIATNFRA